MTKVKQIQYEPYRKKGMYATTMFYNDGAFTVELSADTTDFTTLEIPIDTTSDYRVIASDPPPGFKAADMVGVTEPRQ